MRAQNHNALVLFSGGQDSTTCLGWALDRFASVETVGFVYGQRHAAEMEARGRVIDGLRREFPHWRDRLGADHVLSLDVLAQIGGSALTDRNIAVPTEQSAGIPIPYVPARNTIMLSLALAWAEVLCAQVIMIGANAVDYSGYPDCRPEYLQSYEAMANLATKAAVEGARLRIHAPLVDLTKAQIIHAGIAAGLDYSITVSCYQADEDGRACGHCDSCRIRRNGFISAGIGDPTRYVVRE